MRSFLGLLAAALLFIHGAVSAETFPDRPIKIILPSAPGGGGDASMRLIANEMQRILGAPVVIDFKPGAAKRLGTDLAAKSKPDGYTLVQVSDIHAINEAANRLNLLTARLPYDSFGGFDVIGGYLDLPFALMASKRSGIRTLPELIARAKSAGGLSVGTIGFGSPHHLAMLQLQQIAGVKLLHVPFNGSGPAAAAMLGGTVDVVFTTVGSGMKWAEAGQAQAVAVTGPQRDALAPNVPTLVELGHKHFVVESWMGILAPKGVAADRLALLSSALKQALDSAEVKQSIRATGMRPHFIEPKAFSDYMRTEADRFMDIYRKTPAADLGNL